MLFEQYEGEELTVLYGKAWNMPKNKDGTVVDHAFKVMQYPHQHGTCKGFGHWNPMADAYRESIGGT